MIDGHHLSHLRSKLQLLSVRFVILIFFVTVFLMYQRTILHHAGHLFRFPVLEKLPDKYNLVEKYEQDTLLDGVDPPFKRILFWNDVRHIFNDQTYHHL